MSIFTAGKCKRQFDSPNSLMEVNVKKARSAEKVVEFYEKEIVSIKQRCKFRAVFLNTHINSECPPV